MRRTLLISFVLAALSVSAANGLPDTAARSRKSTVSANASHRKDRHPATHASGSVSRRVAGRVAGRVTGRVSANPSRQASSRQRTMRGNRHPASRRRLSRTREQANPHLVREFNPQSQSGQAVENARADSPADVETASLHKTRVAMPPPLRGSLESLVRQNEKTEDDGLERIEDDEDLADRIARGMLVPVPVSAALTVNGNLPENRRYCRPWTAIFLSDLARAHAAQFHTPLEVSSAVRTVAYQKQLMKVNGNATAAEGDIASPHLTGATIDIAKQGLTRQEIGWMRAWLLPLQLAGKIDVEEEFQQSCFHITVYKSYVPPKPARKPALQSKAAPAVPLPGKAAQDQAGKAAPAQPKPAQTKPAQPKPAQSKPASPMQQPPPVAQDGPPVEGQ